MGKKKKSDLEKAKDKTWKIFSRYIRIRDCIRFKDSLEEGICVTCKREYSLKQLQAGHFIPGRNNAVLFNEDVVYAQCASCNLAPPYGLGGNYIEYFVFMEHEWGRDKIDEFRRLKHTTLKWKSWDVEYIGEQYAKKTQALIDKYNREHS